MSTNSPKQDPTSSQTVIEQELPQIRCRREAAKFVPPNDTDHRVGLALSGGGVRSASFNLGVLQAFYGYGLLRFVDYLSTVSGGGYIGSWLSAKVRNSEKLYDQHVDALGRETLRSSATLEIAAQSDGSQPQAIKDLLHGGQYLDRPLLLANRHLVGMVLNNIAFVSFLLALSGIVAYLWRCLDFIKVRWLLMDLFAHLGLLVGLPSLSSLSDDLYVAFLPAMLIFLFWVLIWLAALSMRGHGRTETTLRSAFFFACPVLLIGVLTMLAEEKPPFNQNYYVLRFLGHLCNWFTLAVVIVFALWLVVYFADQKTTRWGKRLASLTRPLLLFTGIALLVGCAVVLGDGDVGAGSLGLYVLPPWLTPVLATIVSSCLLPAIRPWRLIGSGQKPKNQFETYAFRVASTAILLGIPFFTVFLLARENLSGHAHHSIDDIKGNWKGLAEKIRENRWPANFIWKEIGEHKYYDIQRMQDVKELNQKNPQLSIETLRDIVALPNNDSALGILQDSTYLPVVKRRELLLWALDKVLDNEKLPAGAPPPEKSDLPALGASAVGFGFSPLGQWALLAASAPDPGRTKKSLGTDASATSRYSAIQKAYRASKSNPDDIGFTAERRRKLEDLLDKYWYLYDHKEGVPEFLAEWHKPWRRELNQMLLALHFPDSIPIEKTVVKRRVVIDTDQEFRFVWFVASMVVFVIACMFLNLNATSLHGFYRDQLSETYLKRRQDAGDILLKDLEPNTKKGAPYQILAASVSLYPSVWKMIRQGAQNGLQGAKGPKSWDASSTEGFLFSALYCGSESTGFRATSSYTVNGRDVCLADAMAISGGAVSPIGVRNGLIRTLMTVLNIRLGQWLPNPRFAQERRPSLFQVLWGALYRPENRDLCFVSDGGHYENLGVWPLLERRCFLIVASDASQDGHHSFEDFLLLCRRARLEKGIELFDIDQDAQEGLQLHPLRLEPDAPDSSSPYLRSLAKRFSEKHYVIARIQYPENGNAGTSEGYLVYLKPSLTGDEDNDLIGFSGANQEFPHDPTTNQLLDANQVESYRALGFHIAEKVCREIGEAVIQKPAPSDLELNTCLWSYQKFAVKEIVNQWLANRRRSEPKDKEVTSVLTGVDESRTLAKLTKEVAKIKQALVKARVRDDYWDSWHAPRGEPGQIARQAYDRYQNDPEVRRQLVHHVSQVLNRTARPNGRTGTTGKEV